MLSKEESIMMNHFLKEGLSKTTIAKKLGINRRTVHRYIKVGKDQPGYKPRPPTPSVIDPYRDYLAVRLKAYPELSAARLLVEIRDLGYQGKYTVLKDCVRTLRPPKVVLLEIRFEVSPGQQAQADHDELHL